jgi:hypothetical protein
MKRRRMLLFILPLVLIIGGLYGYSEYNRTNKDLLKEEAVVSITAAELVTAYENDKTAFQQQYTDKIIAVHGTVKHIDADENPVVVSLAATEGLSSVQCSMDSAHAALYKNIKEGEALTIKGVCTGGRADEIFGTDVILNRCVTTTGNIN